MGPRNISEKAKLRNRSRIGKGRKNNLAKLAKKWLEVSTISIPNSISHYIIIHLYPNRNRRNPFLRWMTTIQMREPSSLTLITRIWSDWGQENGWVMRLWMGIWNSLDYAAKLFNIYRKSIRSPASSTTTFAARRVISQ
jgi:hypothetical protein